MHEPMTDEQMDNLIAAVKLDVMQGKVTTPRLGLLDYSTELLGLVRQLRSQLAAALRERDGVEQNPRRDPRYSKGR